MGIGPTIAIPKVLKKVGITKEDVDLFEVQFTRTKRMAHVTMIVDQ